MLRKEYPFFKINYFRPWCLDNDGSVRCHTCWLCVNVLQHPAEFHKSHILSGSHGYLRSHSLLITNVSQSDSGSYHCSAVNERGNTSTAALQLDVRGEMVCWAVCMHGCSQCHSWHTPLSYNIQRNLEQELLNRKNISNNISVKLVANPEKKYFDCTSYLHIMQISSDTSGKQLQLYDIPVSQKSQLAWTWVKPWKLLSHIRMFPRPHRFPTLAQMKCSSHTFFLIVFVSGFLHLRMFSNHLYLFVFVKMCKIKGSGRFLWGKCFSLETNLHSLKEHLYVNADFDYFLSRLMLPLTTAI